MSSPPLTREQALSSCNDKVMREAVAEALDNGWVAHRAGSGRFKFTHEKSEESVFAPTRASNHNTVPNMQSRMKRALRPYFDNAVDNQQRQAIKEGLIDPRSEDGHRIAHDLSESWKQLACHTAHAHYNEMSTTKLRNHVNKRHQFKDHFGVPVAADISRQELRAIHDMAHDGQAVQDRPKKETKPAEPKVKTEVPLAPAATQDALDEEEERSMGDVVAIRPSDEEDEESQRHFGSMQRAVLAVLHEFPGVAMTVEECTDLCVDDLDLQQVSGALWRCSRIEALSVTRVQKGTYRYDPPEGAPNLAVIDRERAGTPSPPAKPRPGVDEPDAVSGPPGGQVAPPPPAPTAGSALGSNDIIFEVVLRAEDGSLVLRASDGTVWNAKKI